MICEIVERVVNEMYNATVNLRLTSFEHQQLRLVAQNIINRETQKEKKQQLDKKQEEG